MTIPVDPIVDEFLDEFDRSEHDMVMGLARELLADGADPADLPRLLQPIRAIVAEHRAASLSRLEALVERADGRPTH